MIAALLIATTFLPCQGERPALEGLPAQIQARFNELEILAPCSVTAFPEAAQRTLATIFGAAHLAEGIASPNERWNSSCVAMAGVPPRKLVLAARSGTTWVVHYWSGGFGLNNQVVVFTTVTESSVLFAGHCYPSDITESASGALQAVGPWHCEP